MELNKYLNLQKGSIVSIVGAGGKSTLMYTLANELRKDYKILVTTTTKLLVPDKVDYDEIVIGFKALASTKYNRSNGIVVYGSAINNENKILGVDVKFRQYLKQFDYILVEADGSKRKPIKGWNETEPVISTDTSITIGVLSIASIGQIINEQNVHRVEAFIELTNALEHELITIKHFISLIFHPFGLFKNSIDTPSLMSSFMTCLIFFVLPIIPI